ncbi:MAG: hypothetical protein JRH11_25960 [Deltaproteobacteria bacterium]|nr:hypothetical protein [Deltaproteobacteria bacterium]
MELDLFGLQQVVDRLGGQELAEGALPGDDFDGAHPVAPLEDRRGGIVEFALRPIG